MEIEYLKSATRLLNRDYFNRTSLDLSKEALWVSVVKKAAELQAVKVVGQKKFYHSARVEPNSLARPSSRIFLNIHL